MKKHPFWSASCPCEKKLKYVKSVLQKSIRRGYEHAALWALNEMYMGRRLGMFDCNIWRSLTIIGLEDIGMAYRPLMGELRNLEWAQRSIEVPIKSRGVTVNADRLAFVQAVLLMCRCKKSRANDEAEGYVKKDGGGGNNPPTQEELDAIYNLPDLAKDDPEFFDDCEDHHTDEGKAKGRGMKHFLERGAILNNKQDGLGMKLSNDKRIKRMTAAGTGALVFELEEGQ
jgi:hypothetical protein